MNTDNHRLLFSVTLKHEGSQSIDDYKNKLLRFFRRQPARHSCLLMAGGNDKEKTK
ncbi:MAG: hypothetical protein H8E85_08335 [Candidatus Marinimicrobia bacterium]|nr:hypothetical protein [Candidatus Neomarinimicrobiota bacterium]